MLDTDTLSNKEYRYQKDYEAFEFDKDIESRDSDIEYYVFSETFQTWVRSSLVEVKRGHPSTYSELHQELMSAYQNHRELMSLEESCEMTEYKNARGF